MQEKIIYILTFFTILYFGCILVKYGSPKIYLLSVLYFLPFMNFLATKVSMGGFKVFEIITLFSVVYLLKYFLADNYLGKKYFQILLFFAFLVVSIIGAFISEHPNNSLIQVIKLVPIFIYARFLILECTCDPNFHYKIIKTLKLVYMIAIAFLCLQIALGLKVSFYSTLNINTYDPLRGVVRYPGYFNDSQAQGQFFAVGCLIFFYNPDSTQKWKFIYCLLAFICLGAVYISGSRSALLGLILAALLAIILINKKYILYLLISGVALFAIFTYSFPNKNIAFGRTTSSAEDLRFRQTIWLEAYKIAQKYPLFGIGAGNYLEYTKKYSPNQYFELPNNEISYFDQPENGYLKILVEFGFVGFSIFLLMILTPLINSFKIFFSTNGSKLIMLLTSCLLSWMIAFNTVYSIMDNRILIIVATLVVLLITFPKHKPSVEPS